VSGSTSEGGDASAGASVDVASEAVVSSAASTTGGAVGGVAASREAEQPARATAISRRKKERGSGIESGKDQTGNSFGRLEGNVRSALFV